MAKANSSRCCKRCVSFIINDFFELKNKINNKEVAEDGIKKGEWNFIKQEVNVKTIFIKCKRKFANKMK